MIRTSTFKKPSGFLLLPVYILVSFFSVGSISEEQISHEGISTKVSQNINLEPSPQNFTSPSLNISKPVSFCFPGILQKINNNFLNITADFYLSKVQQKKQFTSYVALYIFNKVLIH